MARLCGVTRNVAERQGFEPWLPCGKHAFQACAFSHSAISPALRGQPFDFTSVEAPAQLFQQCTASDVMAGVSAGENNESEVDANPDGRRCMFGASGSGRSGFGTSGGQSRTPVSSPPALLSPSLSPLPLDSGKLADIKEKPRCICCTGAFYICVRQLKLSFPDGHQTRSAWRTAVCWRNRLRRVT